MGSAVSCAGMGSTPPTDVVTILTADGTVLSLDTTVRVADLVLEFPNHFMCHSSSLLLLQQVRILPLSATLIPGEVYFLVPIPGEERYDEVRSIDSAAQVEDSDVESLLHIENPSQNHVPRSFGSMKFVISPEQLARIMSGSLKGGKSKLKRTLSKRSPTKEKKGSSSSSPSKLWRSRLQSIGEVEA